MTSRKVFENAIQMELLYHHDETIAQTLVDFGFFESEYELQTEISAGKVINKHGVWINQGTFLIYSQTPVRESDIRVLEISLKIRNSTKREFWDFRQTIFNFGK